MIFTATRINGVFVIDPEQRGDERGFFARTWCPREFEAQGLNSSLAQCSLSHNKKKGTLRGMHYQAAPFEEAKLVRCTQGALYDVALDLRPDSPTFKQWFAVELSSENHRMLYVPEGCAHGFQTLADHSEVFYQISQFYHAESARGVRWNDPAFAIGWPAGNPTLSQRDAQYEDFRN